MDSILNYSETDFPSLGSSARSKSRKRNKLQSPADHPNADENKADQPHQSNCHEESIENSSLVKNSSKTQYQDMGQKSSLSRKPRPTSSVNIEDFLMNSKKPCPKLNVRAKHCKEPLLSGNPLDTDCPIRQKGFMNVPKKPKNLSKIKTAVLEGREEKKKIMNYSASVTVEKNAVLLKSEIPEEYIWKSIVHGKVGDLKSVILGENSQWNQNDETPDVQENEEMLEKEQAPSFSEDTKYSYRMSLQKLLECSEIPPHKILIHHHNFKSYCDNCITEELNHSSSTLVSQIVRYQYNKYQINPTKAVANKRYVIGFKQVTKYVKMNKIKLFIIVPDMEDSLSHTVEELKSLASAYCIPYFFALSRRKLGFLTCKKVGVCCFGILDYSGAETKFNKTLESMTRAKKYYEEKCSKAKSFYESQVTNTSESDQSTCNDLDKMIEQFHGNLIFNEETEQISNF